ncbi:hypothetical protein INR49_024872 [Caranx melampygus]|nr:hypothetical protein INR49_024872 [Caranx melampygus]
MNDIQSMMNDDTCKLFERVAKKMGWMDNGGLDTTEKKLLRATGKSRHNATSHQAVDPSPLPIQLDLSDSGEDPEKENISSMTNTYRNKFDSSDDEFEQFFVGRATLKAKTATPRTWSSAKKDSSNVHVVSSDDDGSFETCKWPFSAGFRYQYL